MPDELTSSDIEQWRIVLKSGYPNTPRLRDEIDAICDMALRSSRSEILEEAARVCDAKAGDWRIERDILSSSATKKAEATLVTFQIDGAI